MEGKRDRGFSINHNSTKGKVFSEDPEFLKAIGMTAEEAKRKYRAWVKANSIDAMYMERWYQEQCYEPGFYSEESEGWEV